MTLPCLVCVSPFFRMCLLTCERKHSRSCCAIIWNRVLTRIQTTIGVCRACKRSHRHLGRSDFWKRSAYQGKFPLTEAKKKKILTLMMTKMAHNSSWSRCRSSMRKAQLFSEHSNKVQIFNLSSSEIFSSWQSFFSRAPISRYTYSGEGGCQARQIKCVEKNLTPLWGAWTPTAASRILTLL